MDTMSNGNATSLTPELSRDLKQSATSNQHEDSDVASTSAGHFDGTTNLVADDGTILIPNPTADPRGTNIITWF